MKRSNKLLLALLTASALYAIPITRGEHPNLDAQFEQAGNFHLAAELGRQFPQYNFVWQDPLVGFFSPTDPAQWAFWAPLTPPGVDPFASGLGDPPCANGRCVTVAQSSPLPAGDGPAVVIPPPGNTGSPGPSDPNASPLPTSIPEPGVSGMLVTGLLLTALGGLLRK